MKKRGKGRGGDGGGSDDVCACARGGGPISWPRQVLINGRGIIRHPERLDERKAPETNRQMQMCWGWPQSDRKSAISKSATRPAASCGKQDTKQRTSRHAQAWSTRPLQSPLRCPLDLQALLTTASAAQATTAVASPLQGRLPLPRFAAGGFRLLVSFYPRSVGRATVKQLRAVGKYK